MFDLQIFTDIAMALVMILVGVLAVYFALRFLGKVAKIVVSVLIVIVVVWILFSKGGVLSELLEAPALVRWLWLSC